MMLLASAGGNRVPVIAQLVQADEDTVREVIHRVPPPSEPARSIGRVPLLGPATAEYAYREFRNVLRHKPLAAAA